MTASLQSCKWDFTGRINRLRQSCEAGAERERPRADPVGEVGNALSQCQTGTPPYGIPVMEKYLTDNKIPLPPRS